MKKYATILFLSVSLFSSCTGERMDEHQRRFIACSGVSIGCTIAGENSCEAIQLASRAGFDCIRVNVRHTKDSVLVAVNDSTLTRAFTYNDGTEIPDGLKICDLTYSELHDNFILKVAEPHSYTKILTLEEFITECKENGLSTFIEPAEPKEDWINEKITATADKVFGTGNYIITSDETNVIVDADASLLSLEEYYENVAIARKGGYEIESHADNFGTFSRADIAKVDYISTNLLAPDYHGQGKQVYFSESTSFKTVEREFEKLDSLYFGGIYMEITWTGTAHVILGKEDFVLPPIYKPTKAHHQLLLFDERPNFQIMFSSTDFKVKELLLHVVEF